MKFTFDDEQLELKRSARKFLASASSSERLRAVTEAEAGYDREVWSTIAGELGWLALTVPEAYDGLGLGPVDLVPLLEETGRVLYSGPFFSTVCFGTNALVRGGSEAQKREHLPAIATGERLFTLALTEASGSIDPADVTTIARKVDGGYVLDGKKRFVLDGHIADYLIVVARLEGTTAATGICLFVVPRAAKGVTATRLPTIDLTRRLAEVVLEGVRVSADDAMGEIGGAASLLVDVLDRAAAALAVEQAGGAEAALDLAIEYAKVRKQFGRAIGSFQAIQHTCANMLVKVESAKSAGYYANALAAFDSPELGEAASIAKSYASEAFFSVAADGIQVHGGIGFTWEHDAQLFYKRARAGETLLGTPSYHRERLARSIGL